MNKDITQIIEVHEEDEKFLRLLQLLGVWYEKGSVLVFVDKQEKCDQLFQELLKLGYPCLSLHGGKDQVDRDHTLHEFKTGTSDDSNLIIIINTHKHHHHHHHHHYTYPLSSSSLHIIIVITAHIHHLYHHYTYASSSLSLHICT